MYSIREERKNNSKLVERLKRHEKTQYCHFKSFKEHTASFDGNIQTQLGKRKINEGSGFSKLTKKPR